METSQRDLICYILGASLILGGHNVWINIQNLLKGKERERPLNRLQVFASVFQLLNQIFFLVELSIPAASIFGGDCAMLSNIEGFVYLTFQIATTTVIILRGTILVRNEIMKKWFRAICIVILAASIICNLISNILRKINISDEGFCQTFYERGWNGTSKILLFVVYFFIMGSFSVPALKHARNTTLSPLKRIMIDASSKIAIAVLLYLLCFVLAFAKVWGMFFYVEFTIENYAAILASTLSFDVKKEQPSKAETLESEAKKPKPPSGTTANFLASSVMDK